jgi:hypothetical protein
MNSIFEEEKLQDTLVCLVRKKVYLQWVVRPGRGGAQVRIKLTRIKARLKISPPEALLLTLLYY